MASLRDAGCVSSDDPVVSLLPVVSLRSTTGYRLGSRWDHSDFAVSGHFGDFYQMIPIGNTDTGYIPSYTRNGEQSAPALATNTGYIPSYTRNGEQGPSAIGTTDAGGIPSCSRWLSEATPPVLNAPEFCTPAGVPANVHASGRFFEHHFPDVRKMVSTGHTERCAGINTEARELEAKIAENVVELLES